MNLLLAAAMFGLFGWMVRRDVYTLFPLFSVYILLTGFALLMWSPFSSFYVSQIWPATEVALLVLLALATVEWSEYAIVVLCDGSRQWLRRMAGAAALGLVLMAWLAPAGVWERWLAVRSHWILALLVVCAAVNLYVHARRVRQFSVVEDHGLLLLAYLGVFLALSTAGAGAPVWNLIERTGASWRTLDLLGQAARLVLVVFWFVYFGGQQHERRETQAKAAA